MARSWEIEKAAYVATPSPREGGQARDQQLPKQWPGHVLNEARDKIIDLAARCAFSAEETGEVLAALKLTDVLNPTAMYTLHGVKSSKKWK